MVRSIRIGKDFNVLWSIHKVVDGERQPYELAGKELELYFRTASGIMKEATEWKVEGNVIAWTFRGKDQKSLGSYELILTENAGKDGMVTVDTCRAFKLVAHSCEETEGRGGDIVVQTIMLETEVAFAPLTIQTGGGGEGGSYDDSELRGMIAEQGERIDELADEVQDLKESGLGYDDTELRQQVGALADEVGSNGVLIEDLQNTKIDKENDDYYPKMAVGLADNLAGVDVVDSEINFRRSGGGAITDGVARIEAIKGNSVVWNQLAFKNAKSTTMNGVTFTANPDGSITANGTASATAYIIINPKFYTDASHKYAVFGTPNGGGATTYYFGDGNTLNDRDGNGTITNGSDRSNNFACRVQSGVTVNNVVYRPRLIDLTKMFGAGNEPTTIEEFNTRIPQGVDLNAYNEGEVISMRAEGIKSVGVNAWDEQWELGRISSADGSLTEIPDTIRSKNFMVVLPDTEYYGKGNSKFIVFYYDADYQYVDWWGIDPERVLRIPSNVRYVKFSRSNATTYDNDICFGIKGDWEGYHPYEEVSEDFGFVAKYFPDGMRSAGTAHDEIRYNKASGKWEKVEAIGTRAYQDGDADKADVLTDGKITTLYPLAEPIVTELDEVDQFKDLDYQVWNAGTEKAIAEGKSTPLSADITYGFNAPAKIKENADKIKENANEIAKLKQSSGSTTTYKTINGTSVVGSGNIDTHYPISSSTASALTIQPNTYYRWSGSTLNVSLGSTDANLCEFVIELSVTGTPSIKFPSSVKWANGIAPTFVSGKSYIVSIVNNLGVYAAF